MGRINPINRERRQRRHEKQFGPKGRWLRSRYPWCAMTGRRGGHHPLFRIELAHTMGTRAAGADSEGLCPLWGPIHRDLDSSMTEARFHEKHGFSRADIRAKAAELHQEWLQVKDSFKDEDHDLQF